MSTYSPSNLAHGLADIRAKVQAAGNFIQYDNAKRTDAGNQRLRFYVVIDGKIKDVTVQMSMLMGDRLLSGGWMSCAWEPAYWLQSLTDKLNVGDITIGRVS
jgi:hypothetical protein